MALYLVIQIGAVLSRVIPRSWRYLIGTIVGDVVFAVWASKRRTLRRNMSIATGRDSDDPHVNRLAVKSMRNYCKYLIEFLELPNRSSSDPDIAGMRIIGVEHLQSALADRKGVILASGHFGTIEIGALRLADFTDFHAVYDTFKPEYLDRLIRRKREEKGINLIPVPNVREMLRVLRHGGTLIVLFDRPVTSGKGVPVSMFGRETAVPGGPAVLGMKTGAAILPLYMFREPDATFYCQIFPPVQWTVSGDRERDTRNIMQALMNTYESVIRSRPDQWYMFRPMWPETGPGHAALRENAAADGPAA